ncbi:MAG: DUF5667 domain-containing protein [Anaerolineales bacterium]|jgi:hypothetical protein
MDDTLPQILADCLDAIDRGEMTLEECLAKYPQYRQELAAFLQIASRFKSAPPVPMRLEFRQNARARLLAQLTDRHTVTFRERLRHIWQIVIHNMRRRSAVTYSLIIAILVSLLGSGIVSASDGARPGDVLYNIDQTIEAMQLNLADPEEAAYLQLDFASERLQEAEQLSMEGDQANVKIALEHYNKMILNVAKTIGQIEDAQQAALGDLLDQTLSVHEEQLARITSNIGKGEQGVVEAEPDEVPDEDVVELDTDYCVGADPHPQAQDLAISYADQFDGSGIEEKDRYDLIMGWFCEGNFGFGEIEHALWTSAEVDEIFPPGGDGTGETDFVEKVELLFAMREANMGWGEIWQELGLLEEEGEEIPVEDKVYCVGVDPHPVAEGLAEDYDVTEEQIMEWFCDRNFGFGEIMHALETSEITLDDIDIQDYSPEELLDMKEEMGGWGKVWQELGLIGKPEDAGKPEDPGNKPDSPPGKPDDVGPNNDTNKPVKTDKPKDKKDKNDKPKD